MIGGLMSKSSYVAMFAAAGLFVGGVALPSAQAADLGGDCCADLEERVAELEATTARKGNRRMSLTVSGQITRSILYWNGSEGGTKESAGNTSGVIAGLESHAQSSRFQFNGDARISPNLKAGFEFMVENTGGARSSTVSQDTVDGGVSTDGTLAVRTANWWLEDKNLGRVTVGRINLGGPVNTIDLGGISTVATTSVWLTGGSFTVSPTFNLINYHGATTYGGDRIEGIRYDSPNIGGFVFQAAWGEDSVWSTSLRYAGEMAGFRLAAGIGYQAQDPINQAGGLDSITQIRAESEWSASLALMHVSTGLFAQGAYSVSNYEKNAFLGNGAAVQDVDATNWSVQAGIAKNYTGLGNTSFYGEYGRANDHLMAKDITVVGSELTYYGLGVVQQIDAAAMELFLGWRRFEGDESNGKVTTSGNLDLVNAGARIRF